MVTIIIWRSRVQLVVVKTMMMTKITVTIAAMVAAPEVDLMGSPKRPHITRPDAPSTTLHHLNSTAEGTTLAINE
jgi:hypothetical protein